MADPVLALGLEAVLGYPAWLHGRIGHPVDWVAAVITGLERRLNRPNLPEAQRRAGGVLTAAIAVACGAGFGWALQALAERSGRRGLVTALLATSGLAQRSLYDHVAAVRGPLWRGDLPAARSAVSRIVGRDVESLDESGVAAAALESLAESFNDGVVAPAFWLAVGGLPGLYAYKAVNTADSLIGHMEPRWRAFGWAAARTDDLANLIPARLAGGLIALAGGGGWRTLLRDAPRHASPNAGWPEAAMAGALKVRLGGPARYDGELTERPAFGEEGAAPTADDLSRGLAVFGGACVLLAAGLAVHGLSRPKRNPR